MGKISETIKNQVRQQANDLCEYCHASEKWQYVLFTVDHVIPLSQGGTNDLENLALACFYCNRQKSNKTQGTDLETDKNKETGFLECGGAGNFKLRNPVSSVGFWQE